MPQILTHTGRPDRHYLDYEGDTDHSVVDEYAQRRKYGGFRFAAAFFGWLVSLGIGTLLVGILSGAGAALALTTLNRPGVLTPRNAASIGIISGAVFLIILAISYFAGGYTAGRLSRFDGARQGFGMWVIAILVTIILGLAGTAAGAKYNVFQQLNLPHIPVSEGSLTFGGVLTLILAAFVSLLAALWGGRVGEQYHRKIDSVGIVSTTDKKARA